MNTLAVIISVKLQWYLAARWARVEYGPPRDMFVFVQVAISVNVGNHGHMVVGSSWQLVFVLPPQKEEFLPSFGQGLIM